jgi:hypothetical protein
MPKELHDKLKKIAKKRKYSKKRANRYIYGTLYKKKA